MQYEIRINTDTYIGNSGDKDSYKNDLILALARFAYSPYLTEQGDICFSIYSEQDIVKINEEMANKALVEKNIL